MSTVRALVEAAPGLEISRSRGRVKDVEECIRKFRRKYRAALEERNTPYEIQHWITDPIGVRVVCLYEDEIEKVAHLLQSHFDVIEVTDKVAAVESTEAEFGYKGLHLDLRWNNAQRATPEHAAKSPWPLSCRSAPSSRIRGACWTTRSSTKIHSRQLKRRINVLSALFELADREFCRFATPPLPSCSRPRTKPPSPHQKR